MIIEQPWGDHRLKMNGVYIGCVTKENADQIMAMWRITYRPCGLPLYEPCNCDKCFEARENAASWARINQDDKTYLFDND